VDNYVDDFFWIMPPVRSLADHITASFVDCLDKVGIDEEITKREGPSTKLEVIGLEWDLINMTVRPSEDKIRTIRAALAKLLTLRWCTLEELESLIGKMTHVSMTMWPAKAFLRRLRDMLYEFLNLFGRKQTIVILPDWSLLDAEWWLDATNWIEPLSIIDEFELRREDIEIRTDGATNGSRENGWKPGIGGYMQGYYIMEEVPECFLGIFVDRERSYEKEFAIPHFEMLAIIVTLFNLKNEFRTHHRILLRCDNKMVNAIIMNKNSKDLFLAQAIRWLCMFAVKKKVRFYIQYIWTKNNVIADALSRFDEEAALKEVHRKRHPRPVRLVEAHFPDIYKYDQI